MGQNKYKWDREALNNCINQMQSAKDRLEEQYSFLEGIQSNVRENWKSMAGIAYQKNLSVDVQLYASLLRELDSVIDDLNQFTNQVYAQCEEQVSKTVSNALQQISAL